MGLLRNRNTLILVTSMVITLFLIFLFFYMKYQFTAVRTEVTEDVMVERITAMGKLELVKYAMKDVLEKKQINRIFPDKRILFVAAGEVTGCIDLSRLKKEDVKAHGDSLTIFLPRPEICYVKLDHQRSKVYDISGVWFPADAKMMVEDIYKLAERKILENARALNVLGKTKENAVLIFKPILENISGKKVGIRFR